MSLKTKNKDRLNIYHNELLDRDRHDTHKQFLLIDGSREIEGDLTLTGSIYFNDTNTEIGEDGSSNLFFKDANAGTLTLTDLKTDNDAIHDNVASEISAITEKATPINADLVIIEDSADSNNKKKVQLGNIPIAKVLITKGDILSFDTAENRLAVGTNDQVLTADSAQSLGVKWADAAGDGGDFANGGEAGGADRSLGNTDNYDLHFLTNNIDRLHIQNDGMIGIGIVNPDSKLEVNGFIDVAAYNSGGYKQGGEVILTNDYTTDHNLIIGKGAYGNPIAGAQYNTVIGEKAMDLGILTNTADSNVAIGYQTLRRNTSGKHNVALGTNTLQFNTTGSRNLGLGFSVLTTNTSGTDNVAVGVYTLQDNTSGGGNTAVGYNALRNNTTGIYNTAIGTSALNAHTIGRYNYGLGISALLSCTSGQYNMGIGYQAGKNITTARYCLAIGRQVQTPSATAFYQLVIGNIIYGTSINGAESTISSGNIGIGVVSPDRRFHVEVSDTVTDANVPALRLSHVGIGTKAVNFATSIEFELEGADGTNLVCGEIETVWTDASAGAEDSDMVFKISTGGAVANEVFRLASDNAMSFFGVAAQAQQAHIVDADGSLADITTKFNQLLADLEGYGLLASS